MSGSVNFVLLVGNLGADPEVKDFSNGGRICNLRIATSDTWKDRETGERRERTDWHQVSIQSDGLIKIAERYLKKGAKVCVQGELRTRSWEQDGQKRYATEVVLPPFGGKLTMLDSPNQSGGGNTSGDFDMNQDPGDY